MTLIPLVLLCTAGADPAEVPPPVGAPWPAEVAPPPHLPGPPAGMAAVPGGYQITLNRRMAERLQDALALADEKQIAASLRDAAKDKRDGATPDPDAAASLELVAFIVSSQLPGFKKALAENMGPGGVVITVAGLQAPKVTFRKPRPRLERVVGLVRETVPLMPDEARDVVEALRAVGRTTPLGWKVEPR